MSFLAQLPRMQKAEDFTTTEHMENIEEEKTDAGKFPIIPLCTLW
jgi:hypothetical protein